MISSSLIKRRVAIGRTPVGSGAVGMTIALSALALPVSTGIAGTSLALPAAAADLQLPIGRVSWLLTVYGWGMSVSMPLAAALVGRFGRRVALLAGAALQAAGALTVLLAPNIVLLSVGRAALAGGAGTAVVLAMGLAREMNPLRARQRTLVIISASIGAVGAAAPMLGSLVAAATSWRLTTALPALSLLAVPAVLRLTATPEAGAAAETRGADLVGVLLLTGVVTALFLALQGPSGGLPRRAILAVVLAGLGAAVTLGVHARRRIDGSIPVGIRKNRRFLVSAAYALSMATVNFAMIYGAPQLLAGTGWSRPHIGAVLAAPALIGAALSWTMANLVLKLGARSAVLPMAALVVTLATLAGLTESLPAILAASAMASFGSSAAQGVLVADATSALVAGLHTRAISLFNLSLQFGSVVGPSLLATLASGPGVGAGLAVTAAVPLIVAIVTAGGSGLSERNRTARSAS